MKVGFKRKAIVATAAITASLCLACGAGLMGANGAWAASAEGEKQYTTTLQSGFGEQFYNDSVQVGTWKQTQADCVEEIDELVGVVDAARNNTAYLDGVFGGFATGDNFTVEYDTKLANGQVCFNFRAAKNNAYIPYQSGGGVIVRLDAGQGFVLSNNEVKASQAYSGSVSVGDSVHVTITVTGTSMDLLVKKDTAEILKTTNLEIVAKDAYIGQTIGGVSITQVRTGFYLEGADLTASFSNIVVKSGSATYKAFPFEGSASYDENAYNNLGEATGKVNPNFSVMCGTMAEGEGGAFLQGKTLHPQFETATVVSDFGGAYGENFTVEFDATMPLANEDINGDEGSGFYFRCDSGADCFLGNTVRLQREGVFVFVYDHENPAVEKFKIGYIFETVPAHGSIVHIKMVVNGTSVTFSFADERGIAIRFLPNRAGEYVTEHTYTGLKAYNAGYDGEADYAGLFTSKTKGKILNFTMTNTDTEKTFKAWPFAAGKEDLSDEFVLTTANSADRIVKVEADSDELGKADRDLIGNFDYVIYTNYNGEGHPLSVARKEGTIEEGLTASILYQLPPYTSFDPYPAAGEVNAGRHGITVKVADEDGYVYASFKWALRILPIELTITGVTAVDRPYDGSRVVELTGGTLVGVPTGAQVSFTLGEGQLTSAAAGTNKEVETDIKLTGADSKNFSLVQPAVTVNITKAAAEAPEKPEATVSGSTITVKATDEDDYLEFRLDDGQWQDSRVFENVSDGKHTVSVRYKDDINTSASEPATVEVTVGSASTGSGCGGSLSTGALFGMAGAVAVVLGASLVLGKKKTSKK